MLRQEVKPLPQSSGASILKSLSRGVNINLGLLGKLSLGFDNLQRNLTRSFVWLLSHGLVAGYQDENDLLRRNHIKQMYFKAGDSDYALNLITYTDTTCVTNEIVNDNCDIATNITSLSFNYETIFTWGYGELGRGERIYPNNFTEEEFYVNREQVEQCLKKFLTHCDDLYNDEHKAQVLDSLAIAGYAVAAAIGLVCLGGCVAGCITTYKNFRQTYASPTSPNEEEAQGLLQADSESEGKPVKTPEIKLTFQQRLDRLRKTGCNEEVPEDFLDFVSGELMNDPEVCPDGHTLDAATIQKMINAAKNNNDKKIAVCAIDRELPLEPTYPNVFVQKRIENFLSELEAKYLKKDTRLVSGSDLWRQPEANKNVNEPELSIQFRK